MGKVHDRKRTPRVHEHCQRRGVERPERRGCRDTIRAELGHVACSSQARRICAGSGAGRHHQQLCAAGHEIDRNRVIVIKAGAQGSERAWRPCSNFLHHLAVRAWRLYHNPRLGQGGSRAFSRSDGHRESVADRHDHSKSGSVCAIRQGGATVSNGRNLSSSRAGSQGRRYDQRWCHARPETRQARIGKAA